MLYGYKPYWYILVCTGNILIKSISQYILVRTGISFWTKFHTCTNDLVHRQSQAGLYEYELVCTNILVFIQVVEIPDVPAAGAAAAARHCRSSCNDNHHDG
jgi:hypothetical protein